jgi:2-keto-4-pentenoate hydratase
MSGDERVARGMRAQLALRRERLTSGERPLGWKVGFGAPAALEQLGIDGPLVGFLTDRSVLTAGADGTVRADVRRWVNPWLEAEIAAHMGRDLRGDTGRDGAVEAIAGLGPAVELADVEPPPAGDPEAILAGNIFHRHVILGPVDSRRRSAEGIRGRVLRNGHETDRTDDAQALTGDLVDVVRHVAHVLAVHGELLRAGEVIITGAVVPPLPVRPGDEVVAELDPLGSLAVSC